MCILYGLSLCKKKSLKENSFGDDISVYLVLDMDSQISIEIGTSLV